MKIQARLIVVFVVLSSMVAASGFAVTYEVGRISEQVALNQELDASLPARLEALNHASHLDNLALSIKYYDEVLTQSARNYAFTTDVNWEARYKVSEPELDAIIKEAISEGGETEKVFFSTVDDANQALIKMELDSISLVNQGRPREAIQILDSNEYWGNKAVYHDALEKYISSRGDEYNFYSTDVSGTVANSNLMGATSVGLVTQLNTILPVLVFGIIAAVVIVGFKLSRGIIRPIENLIRATDELSKGNYKADLGRIGTDETGILASTFDQMRNQLRAKDHNRDEFIRIASHELRTPIQPILGYVELARKNKVDKDKALAEIDIHAKRLARLASDLLDVASIDSGQMFYKMEQVNICDLLGVEAAAARLRIKDSDKVQIQEAFCDRLGSEVFVDPVRIRKALTIILNNAIKFTDKGTIKIVTSKDNTTNEVRIEIQDSGRGILKQMLPRLFGRFASTSSTDGATEGTGLGLHIAAKIIEAHKGKIWGKNNEKGNGATFGFALPAVASPQGQGCQAARNTPPSTLFTQGELYN